MTEWKNLREEFPTDIAKFYLVKATRGEFTIRYLCKLFDIGGSVELTGFSPFGRRFAFHQPKDQPELLNLDLESDDDRPIVMWREIDAD
jgi:hypothetical protein